jgi:hypothetical protein
VGYAALRRAYSTRLWATTADPDVRLEAVVPAPGAAAAAIGALEAGDAGLDAGPEVAQFAVHPSALGHVRDGQAALFVEGDILDAARFGPIEIVAAGIAAVGSHRFGLSLLPEQDLTAGPGREAVGPGCLDQPPAGCAVVCLGEAAASDAGTLECSHGTNPR